MLTDWKGKTAFVTGAGSGIGRALAEALGQRGMRVIATDVLEDTLADTAAALAAAGVQHLAAALDVRDAAAWSALLDRAEAAFGPVQLLCNVAGVTATPGPLLDLPDGAFQWVMDTNLNGSFNGVRAVATRLRERGLPGHILNTASAQGLYVAPNFAPYNASKFAIVGLSETLRIELAPLGIGVSVLCPGPTRGNLMGNSHRIAPGIVKEPPARARSGTLRFLPPAEVAEMAVQGIEQNRLYIHTHPEYGAMAAARCQALLATFGTDADPAEVENLRGLEAASVALYDDVLRNG